MNPAKTIKYLRKQIPAFKCKEGCTDCCGPVPFSKWEWAQIKDQRLAKGITCPYASGAGCEIYEDKPIICRLMGTVPKLKCPHGGQATQAFVCKERIGDYAEIYRDYGQIMSDKKIYCTECNSYLGIIRDAKLRKDIKFLCKNCETKRIALELQRKTGGSGMEKLFGGLFK